MKSVFLVSLLIVSANVEASESSCQVHKKSSDCEVVRTVTRCDVDKQVLRNKIAKLEKKVEELQEQVNKNLARTDTIVYRTRVVDREVEKTVVKHSILALYTTRDVTNFNTATGNLESKYVLGVKYQYQFSFGLVPEVGIDIRGTPILGLGFEF